MQQTPRGRRSGRRSAVREVESEEEENEDDEEVPEIGYLEQQVFSCAFITEIKIY